MSDDNFMVIGNGGKEQQFPFSSSVPPNSLLNKGQYPLNSMYNMNGGGQEEESVTSSGHAGRHSNSKEDPDYIANCQQSMKSYFVL